MRMFQALRAFIESGNIRGLLDGSRRQARLLAQFSEGFGERTTRGPVYEATDYLRRRGVDPAYPTKVDYGRSGGWDDESRVFFDNISGRPPVEIWPDGRRYVAPPEMYSPIASPYEGGRAIYGYDAGGSTWDEDGLLRFPPSARAVGEWQGRGPAPTWMQYPSWLYANGGMNDLVPTRAMGAYPRIPMMEPYSSPSYYTYDPSFRPGLEIEPY